MIAQPSARSRAARRQWRDPLARARLLCGQILAAALGSLRNPSDARAIRMQFGLGSGPPMTMADIGREFGVTGTRVQQLVSRGLAELGHLLGEQGRRKSGRQGPPPTATSRHL